VIHGALAKAIPDRVLAQGADSLWNTQITGEHGEPFTYVFFSGGGMGAHKDGDGLSSTAFPSGIRGVPAEVIESISPVIMYKRELRPDSEGSGRPRGGFGQEMEIGVRGHAPWVLSAMYDRTRCPAQGIQGGSPGGAGAVSTTDGRDLHPKRQQRIEAGERIVLSLPGGGGYGAPFERDSALVARDVRDGLVSVDRASDIYGVVLKEGEEPGSRTPGLEATASLRSATHPGEGSQEQRG
jgi:N-methylhydantoinase B